MMRAVTVWGLFLMLMSFPCRNCVRSVVGSKEEVGCEVVETNITCWGDGELTSGHVQQAGIWNTYTYAKLEEGITIIGSGAFSECAKLVKIDYPSTVVEFKGSCFQRCLFTTFHIKSTVVTVGVMCWNCCDELTTFTVDANHPSGYKAVNGFLMKNNDIVCVGGGVAKTGTTAERTITFPSCGKILASCMRWSKCLGIVIHDDTTEVCSMAFYKAELMTTVTIGKNVATWSQSALTGCNMVTTIILNGNANLYVMNGVFGKKNSKGGQQSILWMANNITSLTIPTDVTTIGEMVLQILPNLTNVSLASGNKNFAVYNNQLVANKGDGSSTFNRLLACIGGATSITVPKNITELYTSCFRECGLLKDVTLHSGVKKFGGDVFRGCKNLTTIDFKSCTMINQDNNKAITPTKLASECTSLSTIKNWPSNTFQIGIETFLVCGFTTLSLPTKCTQLIERSFERCSRLESVTIPNTMTIIGSLSFYQCAKLKTLTFASVSTLKTIDSMAFASCTSLTTITLPCSITSLISTCFAYCGSLTSIKFNYNNGTYLSDGIAVYMKSGSNLYYTFTICPAGLATITLNPETQIIAGNAFYGCNKLTDVTVTDKVTTIQSTAFCECQNLQYVRLPASVTHIDNSAFDRCHNLKKILYCNNNIQVTYSGDPFPTDPNIYVFYDFPGSPEQCDFCGHKCSPILDHECNIPTQYFSVELKSSYSNRRTNNILFYSSSQILLIYSSPELM